VGGSTPSKEYISNNPRAPLFIFGGAFVGLDSIVRLREGRRAHGYVDASGGARKQTAKDGRPVPLAVQPEDLIRFGLIPNSSGACRAASMAEMTEDDLLRILPSRKTALQAVSEAARHGKA
jgi:ATP-dependent Clp protease ATP-binding subunit ClpX